MKIERPLIVFDLETTGIWIEKDKIVELALIKSFPGGQQEVLHRRVNPGISIPKRVSELIQITNEDVQNEPSFKDISAEVSDFLKDSDYAGFNIERFDLPLLQRELREAGLAFEWRKNQVVDAQKVYHLNEKRDLTAAYKFYCNKDLEGAHSALVDAQATLEILEEQVARYGDIQIGLKSLQKFTYQIHDEYYDSGRRFRWWNGKLYMMFGKYAKRHSLQEVVKMDRGYLEWILSADFSEEVKELVENALNGKYPIYEEK